MCEIPTLTIGYKKCCQVLFHGMNEEMLDLLVIPAACIGSAISIFLSAATVTFLYAYDICDDIVLSAASIKVFIAF
jgi:hypothetical protein